MLTAFILIPLLATIFIGLYGAPTRPTALIAAFLNLILGCIALFSAGDPDCTWLTEGNIFNLTLTYGIQQVMFLLTLIVTFAAILGTRAPHDGQKMWYNSTLFISAGAIGAFLSDSILGFFAFHELALIPTFLMIALYGRGHRRAIAWKITLYLGLGSLVLLAGLILVIYSFDAWTFSELIKNSRLMNIDEVNVPLIATLLVIGFGTLISLFPFHSWAAPAYASAPTPVTMMHAGVLKKFGLYGLFVFASLLPEGFFLSCIPWLLVLLVGNVLWVGWVTINQKRLDLTLGFSSVMHMGYIFLAFAVLVVSPGNPIAMKGGVLLMFAHGLSIALLFLLCGSVEHSTGTLEYASLGGLAQRKPRLAFLFGLGTMASIGLPGFANFPGEFAIFFSAFDGWFAAHASAQGFSLTGVQVATICCLWGLVISAVYMLRAYKNVFQGDMTPPCERAGKVGFQERMAAVILVVCLVVVGLFPSLILSFLQ